MRTVTLESVDALAPRNLAPMCRLSLMGADLLDEVFASRGKLVTEDMRLALAMGQTETRGFQSGPKLTPERMVSGVKNPLRIGGTMSCRSAILAPSWPAGPQRSPLTRGGAGSNRCWHGRLPSSPTCSARFRKTSTRRAWSNFSWRSLRHRGDHGPVESSFSTSVRSGN
jgi:hypothetical protein